MRLVLAASLAVLLVGTRPAAAGQPDDAVASERARQLYDEGTARYDTADYAGAIDAWTRAYAALPNADEYLKQRNDLVFNISTAHMKAYEIDHDPSRLRTSRLLLQQYLRIYAELEPERMAAEIELIRQRIAELDRALAKHDEGRRPTETKRSAAARERSRPRRSTDHRPLLGAGVTLLAVGAGAAAAGIAGAVLLARGGEGEGAEDEHDRRLALAAGGGAVAGVALATGVALTVIGERRRKAAVLRMSGAWLPSGGAASLWVWF